MRFWHKLVSTGILAALLLLPFVSMALCVPESAGSMHCPPGCPMMAKMDSGQQMQLKSGAPASCCTVSRGKPAPATESVVVPHAISVEPAQVDAEPVVPATETRATLADASPPPLPDSQARLCTFLI